MTIAYTTADLITLLREKETIPESGVAYSESTLVRYLDQAMKAFIVPAVESVNEEHFVVTKDIIVPAFTTQGNPPEDVPNVLTIPTESSGYRLRDVYIVGDNGGFFNLPRLTPTQAAQFAVAPQQAGVNNWFSGGNAMVGGFYLQGNEVQIWPYGLASNRRFRLTFQRSPADLVLTTAAGRVTAVNGDVLTMDKIVSAWATPNPPPRVGIISYNEPNDFVRDATQPKVVYGSPPVLNDVQTVSVAANVVTLPVGMGASVSVGDWVCGYRESVFAQNIPRELLPCLVQKAAEMCIHAAGDEKGTAVANREFVMMLKNALTIIAPRVIGKPPVVTTLNSAFNAGRTSTLGRW